jgi:antitoxin VapB
MNIASERIDELARRLARVTGEDVETAVERALAERLFRLCVPSAEDRRAALQEFFDLAARMPTNDTRSIDEIIGYGPDGLPAS